MKRILDDDAREALSIVRDDLWILFIEGKTNYKIKDYGSNFFFFLWTRFIDLAFQSWSHNLQSSMMVQ